MRTLWRLVGLLKKYWGWAVVSFVLLMLSTLMGVAIPDLLGMAIDKGVDAKDLHILWLMSGLIIGASILRGVFAFGQGYLSEFIGQKVAYDLRNAFTTAFSA